MRKKPNSHPHAWIKDRVKGFRDSGKSLGGLAKALGWAQPRLSELMKGKGKKYSPKTYGLWQHILKWTKMS